MILGLILNSIFCILIPHKIGRYRQIGFWGSAICCLLLTPVVGLIITLCSKKLSGRVELSTLQFRPKKKKKKYKSEFPIKP